MARVFSETPKINTSKMEAVMNGVASRFQQTHSLPSLWICGRSSRFGLRPSLVRDYLSRMMDEWFRKLEKGVVIVPIVFYACSDKDAEKVDETQPQSKDFLVYSHYNILISYLQRGEVVIERYEPADATRQGDLNERLRGLLTELFAQYHRKVRYLLVAERGMQAKHGDKTLCGHHIVYWIIHRLKYGFEKSREVLRPEKEDTFVEFCRCITDEMRP